jgi:hypothetical protein
MLSAGYKSYLEAVQDLPPRPTINGSMPLDYQVARVLAYSGIPQTPTEIGDRLRCHGVNARVDDVRGVLAAAPSIFANVRRWYWQLGR